MPTAKVRIAASVKPGDLRSIRPANAKSWIAVAIIARKWRYHLSESGILSSKRKARPEIHLNSERLSPGRRRPKPGNRPRNFSTPLHWPFDPAFVIAKHRALFLALLSLFAAQGCSKSRDDAHAQQVAERVRTELLHAWNNYERYAWGHDALKPLSKTSHDW